MLRFNRHRKLLFQNRGLDITRRRELFRTLILSKLLYGAESWTLRDGKDKHYLHSALMRLYNRLLPVQQHPPRSDAAILADTGLPDPAVLLRTCRLRYLGQLYGIGDRTSWGLFNDDADWQALIWCDLQWMWSQLKDTSKLPDPRQGFQQWEYLMRHHPGFWKRLVRRAGDHDCGQRRNLHIVAEFHGDFLKILHDHGRLCHAAPRIEVLPGEQIHACMMCEKRFLSKGGCGAHLFSCPRTSQLRATFVLYITLRGLHEGIPHICQAENTSPAGDSVSPYLTSQSTSMAAHARSWFSTQCDNGSCP